MKEKVLKDIWDESASVPFWGRMEQLQKQSDLIGRCLEIVTESESIREMVLESWLVLDYVVRDLLVSGFRLDKFCQEDFYLRFILLPQSFEGLLQFLKETISFQSNQTQEPITTNDYPPYIHSNFGFLKHLRDNHHDTAETLKKIEAEYFAKRHPELAEEIKQGHQFFRMPDEEGPEWVPNGWLEVVNNLDDNWFKLARRLNKARNKAAHSYDTVAIAKAFGIVTQGAVNGVRVECLQLLKDLLGLTLKADAKDKT